MSPLLESLSSRLESLQQQQPLLLYVHEPHTADCFSIWVAIWVLSGILKVVVVVVGGSII